MQFLDYFLNIAPDGKDFKNNRVNMFSQIILASIIETRPHAYA
jgi:hypothetical protein